VTHYLDLGFLLCLVTKASGTPAAWEAIRNLPQPIPVFFCIRPSLLRLAALIFSVSRPSPEQLLAVRA